MKSVAWNSLAAWRKKFHGKLVVTNGCFDVLHVGHVRYLQAAASKGDLLLVGINDDESVHALKGDDRPMFPQDERAEVVAALACVGAVCVFPGLRATRFLKRARPSVWVKGGDYTLATLDQSERECVLGLGGHIELLPLTPGRSTTLILRRREREHVARHD